MGLKVYLIDLIIDEPLKKQLTMQREKAMLSLALGV